MFYHHRFKATQFRYTVCILLVVTVAKKKKAVKAAPY